jgi:hypothetical protein
MAEDSCLLCHHKKPGFAEVRTNNRIYVGFLCRECYDELERKRKERATP